MSTIYCILSEVSSLFGSNVYAAMALPMVMSRDPENVKEFDDLKLGGGMSQKSNVRQRIYQLVARHLVSVRPECGG